MLTQLLEIFGFLAVLLRAAALAGGALLTGGIAFSLLVTGRSPDPAIWQGARRMIFWSALLLVCAQAAFVAADTAILQASADVPFTDILDATYFLFGMASIAGGLAVLALLPKKGPTLWLLLPALAVLASTVATSHAAARVDYRLPAIFFTAIHQGTTATWIGGLPYLLLTIRRTPDAAAAERVGRRFSTVAQWSVAGILGGGVGLGFLYIDSLEGLMGTSYGIMVVGKAVLFGALLAAGALNYGIVRGLKRDPSLLMNRLRRLTEVEIGIGFTVVLAAASLTSQPPAADLTDGRATLQDVVERFTPKPPRLHSPLLSELSPPTLAFANPQAPASFVPGAVLHPNTAGDIAWSEYNHNWAGLAVLTMGLLAVCSRLFKLRWARHWPLAFFGLAYFLLLRADPEAWPLGPKGFWVSMLNPEVLQHRLFALMIVAFAIFEWGVQNGRIRSPKAALVFPAVCALGGALLLTHSHALGNYKEEYLVELSHLPLALLAVLAGWSRWLEHHLDRAWTRIPSNIWPLCFVGIGLLLLFYREA